MTAVVIYDSLYGNTDKIAHAIGAAINGDVIPVGEASLPLTPFANLLIVGSPTQGGRPTPSVQHFLNTIPPGTLKGVSVAAFDTRFAQQKQPFPLRLLMKIIDYAAPRIAKTLKAKGGILIAKPEGFIVEGKEGPLKTGELVRAAHWAKEVTLSG